MKYKALLLDFYGTLVAEDDHLVHLILEEIAAQSPLCSDAAQIARSWDFQGICRLAFASKFRTQRVIEVESLRLLLDKYQVAVDAQEMAERLFAYWRAPTVYEDANRFLLRNALPVCLVSNIDTADLTAACLHAGWSFDHVVTSEPCRSYKPRPEMFLRALEKLDCAPHEALHIGDSFSSDVQGAQALHIDAAWVNRKGKPLPSGSRHPAFTITTLDALLPSDD